MTLYHIDTDMGVDDGLAVVVADRMLGASLSAISTVFGNVPVQAATRNAQIFRRLLGHSGALKIYAGADRAKDGFVRDARHVHGRDGLGGATSTLGEAFLRDIEAETDVVGLDSLVPEETQKVVVALGPATNIPTLVARYGRANVERIVVMGGVFLDVGNVSPTAEFNALCDPLALRDTLALGIPVTIVPLDVCRKVQLTRATVTAYLEREPSELMRLVVGSHMAYMDFYRAWEGIDACFPHDAIAVLAAARRDWFFRVPGRVSVDLAAETRGRTSIVLDGSSHVDVVFGGHLKKVRDWLGALGDT